MRDSYFGKGERILKMKFGLAVKYLVASAVV